MCHYGQNSVLIIKMLDEKWCCEWQIVNGEYSFEQTIIQQNFTAVYETAAMVWKGIEDLNGENLNAA
jgi:hypothetical protein